MRIEILGVPVDSVTRGEALEVVSRLIRKEGRGYRVFTPNPEMVVAAQRDGRFLDVLRMADLAVPDGTGLLWAANWKKRPLKERVTGTDLMQDLVARAAAEGWKVFLLGGQEGVAEDAAHVLLQRHPELRVAGAASGGWLRTGLDGRQSIQEETMEQIRRTAPDILFVAFGHGKQEKWIADNLAGLPSVRLAMGIGGAFDFIAGRVRRAPAWVGRLGLEWLWRLISEPQRARRIWDAVAVFPYMVIKGEH